MAVLVSLFVFLLMVINLCYGGQLCSYCSDVELGNDCQHTKECKNNEQCYTQEYTSASGMVIISRGCKVPEECPDNSPEIIIGKKAVVSHLNCLKCCNQSERCNQNLACGGIHNTNTTFPRDCSELVVQSHQNGSHTIYPFGSKNMSVCVYCIFDRSGAWTIIQKRFNGSVNFYRGWEAYKRGFGTSNGEYWIGNDVIHALTDRGKYMLKVILVDFANATRYATYNNFHIANEAQGYRLSLTGYSGTAGDGMLTHNGMAFSTFDMDNDQYQPGHCAIRYSGAWWYSKCLNSNLNGKYLSGAHRSYGDGIDWFPWHGYNYSLKETTMMIQKY